MTKSDLVLRDVDLLRRIAEHNQLCVNLTVTTSDTALARILEPRAPRPDLRLQAVSELTAGGIPAGVICAPVLPGITDSAATWKPWSAPPRSRRAPCVCESLVSEAVFGERFPALPGEGIPSARRAVPAALLRAGVRLPGIPQAHLRAHGGTTKEAWHRQG